MSRRLQMALLCALSFASACTSEVSTRTQVLVTIDAAATVRGRAERLRVELFSGPKGTTEWKRAGQEIFDVQAEGFTWPASLALIPKAGDGERGFRLIVHAERDGADVLQVRAASYFIEGKTLLLELTLDDACIGYFECEDGQTCKGQGDQPQCVDEDIDALKLKDIDKAPPIDRDQDKGSSSGSMNGKPDAAPIMSDGGGGGSSGGGTGGTPSDAGRDAAQPSCGAEDCTNDRDDDCDGMDDCADSDCADLAQCVPMSTQIGVLVDAGMACPKGFQAKEIKLHSGLRDPGCSGCSCGAAGATSCSATVYTYAEDDNGNGNANCIVGTVADTYQIGTGPCVQTPFTTNSYVGWSVGAISASGGSCAGAASGTAKPATPTWDTTKTFCIADSVGGGCAPGKVCTLREKSAPTCRSVAADAVCSPGKDADEWFQSYDDSRSCGACSCTSSGASCAAVKVQLGSDYSCSVASGGNRGPLGSGEKYCDGFPYSPPGFLVGSPSTATCDVKVTITGALTKTKPLSLCCEP